MHKCLYLKTLQLAALKHDKNSLYFVAKKLKGWPHYSKNTQERRHKHTDGSLQDIGCDVRGDVGRARRLAAAMDESILMCRGSFVFSFAYFFMKLRFEQFVEGREVFFNGIIPKLETKMLRS